MLDTLKFIESYAQTLLSRLQGIALTALLLFLAAPRSAVSLVAAAGTYLKSTVDFLLQYLEIDGHTGFVNARAIAIGLAAWAGIQVVFLLHAAILKLLALIPRRSFVAASVARNSRKRCNHKGAVVV